MSCWREHGFLPESLSPWMKIISGMKLFVTGKKLFHFTSFIVENETERFVFVRVRVGFRTVHSLKHCLNFSFLAPEINSTAVNHSPFCQL